MNERFIASREEEAVYRTGLEITGKRALREVDRKYGRGAESAQKGEHELKFHNGTHSRMVGRVAAKLCEKVGFSPLHQLLGRTVGYAHDIIQLEGAGTNEARSATWLSENLEHFPRTMKAMANKAIIGTTPVLENGILVRQRAVDLEYSSLLEEQFAKSVACADLSELYSPVGPYVAHQLHHEFNPNATDEELFEKVAAFQRLQCELLENYRYPLKEGEELFGQHRAEVLGYAEWLAHALETGTVTTWDELLEHDRKFCAALRAGKI